MPTRSSRLTIACVLALFVTAADAPTVPAQLSRTAGFRPRASAIQNGRLVIEPGRVIDDGTLLLRDGRIAAAGPAGEVAVPPDAEVIDAAGLYVYPGFVDAAATDLLDPDGTPAPVAGRSIDFSRDALAATPPDHRHSLTPEFRAADALRLDASALEAARRHGFTGVHLLPSGRVSAGQGALVATSGAPPREALLSPTTFHHFRLFPPGGNTYPSTLMGATAHLRQALLDAGHAAVHDELYRRQPDAIAPPPVDPALAALEDALSGRRRTLFFVESRDDVHRALDFAAEHALGPVLWGGREIHRCLDRLERDKPDVLLAVNFGDEPQIAPQPTQDTLTPEVNDPLRVQQERRRDWKERVAGPAALHRAGVRFAFSAHGLDGRDGLLKNVRQAIAAGLDRDAALAALTRDAAAILGAGERVGSLAPGKLAHVVVMTGPFDHPESKVRHVFVGEERFEYHPDAEPVAPGPDRPEALDLAGRWRLSIDSTDGTTTADLELVQDGRRLRGRFTSETGNGRLTSGEVSRTGAEFVVGIGAGDRTLPLRFTAEQTGGGLSGELRSPFGAPAKWMAQRLGTAAEPESAGRVQLAFEESAGASAPQDADDEPVVAPPPGELPTELRSDRLFRPLQTGGNVLIQNATVLTGTAEALTETSILVRGGRIAAIGRDLSPDEGMAVIDATGRYVMPGIIDTHSHIMITGGVNESTQSIVPEVRVKDVVNSDDVAEFRALAGGVTTARLLHGSADVVGGQDAVVKLKHGATAREHILHDAPQGIKFALGENVKFRANRFPNTRLGVEATLNRAFLEAVDYRRRWMEYERALASSEGSAAPESPVVAPAPFESSSPREPRSAALLPPRRDLRLEALADVVNHRKFIHSHCYRADEILMLLRVASDLGVRVWSLQHVLEGYKVAPEIVAHGASCSSFSDWWAYKVEAFDAIPHNAALLHEAGANVVIKSDDAELIRHLYLEAAKTVRYGNMHPDHALQTITLNAARELGIDERIGSIEVGKDADLAIFSGHPLSTFSRCEMTLIEGEVCFSREHAPTAMSPQAARTSAAPPPFELPERDLRGRDLGLPGPQPGTYALVGATLHPVDAPAIPHGTLLIEGDRIAALGPQIEVPSTATVIDLTGLHVTPGLIDAGTTLGLVEIGRVRETNDHSEEGPFQPDLRAGVAVNPDSELIPVARAGGITTSLIRPTGGVIAGQASLLKLAGWTAPEMMLALEAGLQIQWPAGRNAGQQAEELEQFFQRARQYDQARRQFEAQDLPGPVADPRLEAMRPYLAGERPVFIEAHARQQMAEALLFAEKHDLDLVLTGGTDAWKLADELKRRDVPVIVGPVMRRPTSSHDPSDAPYANPGRLHEAGVRFCIRSDSASNSRNAPFEAGMAVAFGLPEEAALRSVTLSAAEILGVAEQLGSLAPGKLANLVIADGSPLQPSTQTKAVFLEGRPYNPESRQSRFYDRYRQRLAEIRERTGSP